jgi:hypothetical protein
MGYGKDFNLNDDAEIVKINYPSKFLKGGPYCVVSKDLEERVVIVALEWKDFKSQEKKYRCLAYRWFSGENGFPKTEGTPEWTVIPLAWNQALLDGLEIPALTRKAVELFLDSQRPIDGNTLSMIVSSGPLSPKAEASIDAELEKVKKVFNQNAQDPTAISKAYHDCQENIRWIIEEEKNRP